MKAILFDKFGGSDVLRFGDAPDPEPSSRQVVVDVVAASVNGADWKVREGKIAQPKALPHILGRDFSGIVSAIADDVDDLKVGDEIFGVCDVGQEGAYAEKIAIDAKLVALKPDWLSHIDAAALALAGITAICAIEDTLKLQTRERILIHGGAGGVGSFAIQLSKYLGAYVISTASARNHEYLSEMGADELIDYSKIDFTNVVTGCDAVFDTVGGDVAARSFMVLKPGGRAAFIASGQTPLKPERSDVVSLRPLVTRSRAPLERISDLVKIGAVKPLQTTVYDLSDAAEAHRISEARHLRGKLVLKVR